MYSSECHNWKYIILLAIAFISLTSFLVLYVEDKNYIKTSGTIHKLITDYSRELNREDAEILEKVFLENNPRKIIQRLSSGNINEEFIDYMQEICYTFVDRFKNHATSHDIYNRYKVYFDSINHYILNSMRMELLETPLIIRDAQDIQPVDIILLTLLTDGTDEAVQGGQPLEEQIAELKEANDEQNVHERAVIDTSSKILKAASENENNVLLENSEEEEQMVKEIYELIDLSSLSKKEKKIAKLSTNLLAQTTEPVSPYGQSESEVMYLITEQIEKSKNQDHIEYFVEQLADMSDKNSLTVCPTGRIVRLVDVLAFISDEEILPDHVIKEQALDKLKEIQLTIQQSDHPLATQKDVIYEEFRQYVDSQLLNEQLIDGRRRDEFLEWVEYI